MCISLGWIRRDQVYGVGKASVGSRIVDPISIRMEETCGSVKEI